MLGPQTSSRDVLACQRHYQLQHLCSHSYLLVTQRRFQQLNKGGQHRVKQLRCAAAEVVDRPKGLRRGRPRTRKTLADPAYAWLAAQLHPTKNWPDLRLDEISTGTSMKLWWQCQGCPDCGRVHKWQASVASRAGRGGQLPTGCPACCAYSGGPGVKPCFCRSVAADAQLSREWCSEGNGGVLPETVARHSMKMRKWMCLRDPSHGTYLASPHRRSGMGTGCPECAKVARRVKTKRGSLTEEQSELAAQWDYQLNDRTPESVPTGSTYMANWICSESTCQHPHSWKATVWNRVHGSGCPYCSRHVCCPCNSLAGKYPELLAEWDIARNAAEGRNPEQVSPRSGKLAWWENAEKGPWQQSPDERVEILERRRRVVEMVD